MFKFIHAGGPYGDSTSAYEIELDKEYTVGEFIQTVITEMSDEWGRIILHTECPEFTYPSIRYFERPYCDYEYGNITCDFHLSDYSAVKVESVLAHGGWSAMDYRINVDFAEIERSRKEAFERFLNEAFEKRKAELKKRRTVDISPVEIPDVLPVRKKRGDTHRSRKSI